MIQLLYPGADSFDDLTTTEYLTVKLQNSWNLPPKSTLLRKSHQTLFSPWAFGEFENVIIHFTMIPHNDTQVAYHYPWIASIGPGSMNCWMGWLSFQSLIVFNDGMISNFPICVPFLLQIPSRALLQARSFHNPEFAYISTQSSPPILFGSPGGQWKEVMII